MELVVGPIYTLVDGASEYQKRVIRKAVRAKPSGYQFSEKYKMGIWDGYITMFKYGKFPSGLLRTVRRALSHAEANYDVVYAYDKLPGSRKNIPNKLSKLGVELRDYQVDAARKLMKRQNGIVRLPTSSGKTFIIAAVVKAMGKHRSVVLVYWKDLLYQTADVLSAALGKNVGVIGDGIYQSGNRITVISVPTLRTKLKRIMLDFKDVGLVVLDECHHAAAQESYKALMKFPQCIHRRYGFSATPLKHTEVDDMKVIGAFGRIVYDMNLLDVAELGYVLKPSVIIHNIGGPELEASYLHAYEHLIVNNSVRNKRIAGIAGSVAEAGPVLVTVKRIEHARLIASQFGTITDDRVLDGYTDCYIVTGSTQSHRRETILNLMRSNCKAVIVTTVFGEGVDVPSIRGVVLAGGGKSEIDLLQRIGRSMRVGEGKSHVEVHDFYDSRSIYLREHSVQRRIVYEQQGFNVSISRT